MPRSLKVHPTHISRVKLAVKQKYHRQKDLAEDIGISLATVSNYLNGKPVDHINFVELSEQLELEWKDISGFSNLYAASVTETADAVEIAPYIKGALNSEETSFIYVDRPPTEISCYQALLHPGALVRIKAPNLMGKTSLIAKVLSEIEQKQKYRTVHLNLHLANQTDFQDLNRFLKWFCASVSQLLGLPNRLGDYWDETYSTSKVDCTDYFEKYLLAEANEPLVICLDEVDRIFEYRDIAADFLGLLRAWHEQAKIKESWQKLRLLVAHSTEVYIPLNINESPFNVGFPIELPEFNTSQVQELSLLHGLHWSSFQVEKLMEVVGGHPYLVEQAFSHLKIHSSNSLEQFLETAPTEAGIYGNHLRRLWRILQKQPELIHALKQAVVSNEAISLDSEQAYQLHRMGLLSLEGNKAKPRCKLYQQYFCKRTGAYMV